jgi:hypothetical protein
LGREAWLKPQPPQHPRIAHIGADDQRWEDKKGRVLAGNARQGMRADGEDIEVILL